MLYQEETLCLEDFWVVKSSVQKLGKLIRRSGIRRMGGHPWNLDHSPCEAAQSVLARSATFQRTLGSFSSWKGGCRIVCYICVGKGLLPAGLWLALWLLLGYTQCLRWDVMRRERSQFHEKAAHRNPGKQNSFPHSTTNFLCDAGQSLRLVLSQVANNYIFHHLKVFNLD